MSKSRVVVAGSGLFTLLLTGCYSSVLVSPTGEEKERIRSDRISFVLTKADTMYAFQTAPTVVKDSIVGEVPVQLTGGVMPRRVSIPLSEVAAVSVKEFKPVSTIVVSLSMVSFMYFLAAWGFFRHA